jgi:hypothetical protein
MNNKMVRILAVLAAVGIITALCVFLLWDRIVIDMMAKQYDLMISYSSVKNHNFKELQFENLKAILKKQRSGIFAENAKLMPSFGAQTSDPKSLAFELKGVRFIPAPSKNEPKKTEDRLLDLVNLPFSGKWGYKEIYGEIAEHEKGLQIRKLVASGDMMRMSANGYLYKNNKIAMYITIYLSKDMTKELPDMVSEGILKNEPGEWKSFSANLTGDLSAPSIELSGKLFRLNIKQIEK